MTWQRIAWWLRFGAVAWVAGVGIVAVLQYYGFVPKTPRLEPYVWVFSLVIIAVDNVGTLISRRIRARLGKRYSKINKALMGLLINLAKSRSIRFEELGASVYVPWIRDRLLRKAPSDVRLKRVIRFRPAGFPQQSGVSWTPDKGTVGDCWRSRRTSYKDWSPIAKRYSGMEITPEAFAKIPPATRAGFDHHEFVAIVDKYAEIIAEPVWHPRKEKRLVGVLAIDRPHKASESTFRPQLGKKETLEAVAATASVVGGILNPKADGE